MGRIRQRAGGARRRLRKAWIELTDPPPVLPEPSLTRNLSTGRLAHDDEPVTRTLHARLGREQLEAVAAAVVDGASSDDLALPGSREQRGAFAERFAAAEGVERMRAEITAAVTYGPADVRELIGIPAAIPPEDVHSMVAAAGPFGSGGGLGEADFTAAALISGGAPPSAGQKILDFGCSSGRVVKTLRAAYPDVEWHGCDPNGPAVEWAGANLPGISFFRSENEPPLALDDDTLDAAVAVSIWSHYAEALALRWYDEMWRVLKPGGLLALTTHGPQAVAHYHGNGLRSEDQLTWIQSTLWSDDYWYVAEFGEQGDWGVVNDEWGTAFVTAEWMLRQLTPRWEIVEFATGRNDGNQDLYVLRKPAAAAGDGA